MTGTTRSQRRQAAELAVLDWLIKHEDEWARARELAERIERPWRSTARALARLTARGVLRQKILSWKDAKYRPRETKLYQAVQDHDRPAWHAWPDWAVPRVLVMPPTQKPPKRYDNQDDVNEFIQGERT